MPAWLHLPPDCLAECECRLDRRGSPEEQQKARDGPAVIIEDYGQPGLTWLVQAIRDEDIELGVIGLPDGIWPLCLRATDEVKGIAISLRTVMGQGY